jgi:hypothetical protein
VYFSLSYKERIREEYKHAIRQIEESLGISVLFNPKRDVFYFYLKGERIEKTAEEMKVYNNQIKDKLSGEIEDLSEDFKLY